ncbi:UNVERIFIED_CONTAM: hypothetical protein Scaly_1792700 [Sesamum calycinum]|uniref:SWIM-type domain-containing protein n=1 Tax=Sesamum calycinum TaxID=2727403 RepID=A0AAW2NW20_9LAMI
MGEGEGDNGNERVDRNEGEGVVGTEEVFMGEGEGDAGTEEVDVDVGAGEGVDGTEEVNVGEVDGNDRNEGVDDENEGEGNHDDESESNSDSDTSLVSKSPSWMLEDLEGPWDDDIFINKPENYTRTMLKFSEKKRERKNKKINKSRGVKEVTGGLNSGSNSSKEVWDGEVWRVICPNIIKKTEIQRKESRNCFPSWAGEDKYEVMHFMQNHIVYLKNRFCSCGIFQLVGYLCCHAIATVDYHRLEVEDYIDDCFSKAVYMKVYSHMVNSVPGMHDNEDSGMGKVDPPNVIIKFGRPRKSRRRDANDVMDTATTSRKESKPRQTEMQHLTCCIRFKKGQTKIKTSPTLVPAAYAASNLNPTLEQFIPTSIPTQQHFPNECPSQTRPAPVSAASAANFLKLQPPLSKAARKQQRPISTSSKLAKRKQAEAPSQPTTF